MSQNTLLQWIIVDDELHHVSEYAHLIPKSRPPAYCPACDRPVVLKLGKQKIHHAAHSPESSCVLTGPETAIHFNTKMHIARQIQHAEKKRLYIPQTCTSCYAHKRAVLWAQNWDDVKVERRLENNLQPDILLIARDNAHAAIEIFVTHSVDDQKTAKLKAINLPWLEIKGRPELYSGDEAWHIDLPLPVFHTNYIFDEAWLCRECFKQVIKREMQREWLKNNGVKSLEYKVIDFFYSNSNGRWMRNLFTIECNLANGVATEFRLTRQKKSLNFDRIKYVEEETDVISRVFPPVDTKMAIQKLKEEGRKFLRKIKNDGTILDSPMPWIEKEPSPLEFYDLRNFPRRYYFNQKSNQWFMPKDRKSVIWFNDQGHLDREITYWHRS